MATTESFEVWIVSLSSVDKILRLCFAADNTEAATSSAASAATLAYQHSSGALARFGIISIFRGIRFVVGTLVRFHTAKAVTTNRSPILLRRYEVCLSREGRVWI